MIKRASYKTSRFSVHTTKYRQTKHVIAQQNIYFQNPTLRAYVTDVLSGWSDLNEFYFTRLIFTNQPNRWRWSLYLGARQRLSSPLVFIQTMLRRIISSFFFFFFLILWQYKIEFIKNTFIFFYINGIQAKTENPRL